MHVRYFLNPFFSLSASSSQLPIVKHSDHANQPCLLIITNVKNLDAIIAKKNFIKGIISHKENACYFDSYDFEFIECDDPANAWSFLCKQNFPLAPQFQIGITGTNGKTSTTYFTYQILYALSKKHGLNVILINSLGVFANGSKIANTNNTTPDSYIIHKSIHEFCSQHGVENCFLVIEVSSIGIQQKRIEYLNLDVAIWTNFSQEHIDYHKTMENYFNEKKKLSKMAKEFWVHNSIEIDDASCKKYGDELKNVLQKKQLHIEYQFDNTPAKTISLDIFGKFQAQNLLSSIVALRKFFNLDQIFEAIKQYPLKAPAGRMEIAPTKIGTVIIDNSHKPVALQSALESIRESVEDSSKIIVVCGCGGNRDQIKRPMIGKIMQEFSDLAIITNDNPRYENPIEIIQQIQSGTSMNAKTPVMIIPDRKTAIKTAMNMLGENDVCLIAGKGNETTIEINGEFFPFSDIEVVASL